MSGSSWNVLTNVVRWFSATDFPGSCCRFIYHSLLAKAHQGGGSSIARRVSAIQRAIFNAWWLGNESVTHRHPRSREHCGCKAEQCCGGLFKLHLDVPSLAHVSSYTLSWLIHAMCPSFAAFHSCQWNVAAGGIARFAIKGPVFLPTFSTGCEGSFALHLWVQTTCLRCPLLWKVWGSGRNVTIRRLRAWDFRLFL